MTGQHRIVCMDDEGTLFGLHSSVRLLLLVIVVCKRTYSKTFFFLS